MALECAEDDVQYKRLECFIGQILDLLPYQIVKDAAMQSTTAAQCPVEDVLRPVVAELAFILREYQTGKKTTSSYRFCNRLDNGRMEE